MKVTQITDTKRSGVKSIFIDGQYEFAAHLEIILNNKINEGMEIDEGTLAKAKYEEDYLRAKKKAFDMLARKDWTEAEIRKKLLEKEIDETVADNVICLLNRLGYIDDYRYAKNMISVLSEQRKYGKYKIKQYLLSKSVSREIVDELLDDYMEQTDIGEENIIALIKKKKNIDFSDVKQRKKVYDMLVRKGYEYSQVKSALEKYLNCEIDEN